MSDDKNAAAFNKEIDEAFQKAWHSEKGGDDRWKEFMTSYGAQSLSGEEKKMLFDSEMKIVKGAFPVELRRVYEKILDKYSNASDASTKNLVINFNADAKVKEYYQKIKPFTGMNDIFGNAAATSTKYSTGLQKAKHHTMTCKNCGAPRLEEMQYDKCLFCGSNLFEPAK